MLTDKTSYQDATVIPPPLPDMYALNFPNGSNWSNIQPHKDTTIHMYL